jgi:hypothetical protein
MPDDPNIPSRTERLRILSAIVRGEVSEQHVLADGRIVEVPTPTSVRIEALKLLFELEDRGVLVPRVRSVS